MSVERRSFEGVGVQPLQPICGQSGPIGTVMSLAVAEAALPKPAPALPFEPSGMA